MSSPQTIKLLPRNVAALRRAEKPADPVRTIAGNPVSTRLESGVGNCFPGLEFDLRNLERRFFPFLEVDIFDNEIRIVAVDMAGARAAATAGNVTAADLAVYREIAADVDQGRTWQIDRIQGNFGPLGNLDIQIGQLTAPSMGDGRRPPDGWTAVRLLVEGSAVTLGLQRGNVRRQLSAPRAAYLDSQGSLAAMFEPGELTQSLCSPWTHDFRDCGCFYWASNHPDIARPPTIGATQDDPRWNAPVPWERRDRSIGNDPPSPATADDPVELVHYAINQQWQALNFVIEGRETITPYRPGSFAALPLASRAELETFLRYAAGVELGVIHEYLAAAYSLRDPATLNGALRDSVEAAHAEVLRIAFGEMRHLRAVNDVLQALLKDAYRPALQVAAALPLGGGTGQPVRSRPLDPPTLQSFIDIEQPAAPNNRGAIDSMYGRILATLEQPEFGGTDAGRQSIRSIIAEGEEHFETFENIQIWLRPFQPQQYLRPNLQPAPANNPQHRALQERYRALLEKLYAGYAAGIPQGASNINDARSAMLGNGGLVGAVLAVADAGFLVSFDAINDPRFVAVNRPA